MQKSGKGYHKYMIVLILIILLSCIRGIRAHAVVNPKKVLIINSYQKGLGWTDDQTEGITSVLKESGIKSNISVEYMDWKSYPTQENLNRLYDYLKYKYANKKIDIILTTDDAALEFTLKNREELFPGVPIVFCGVNKNGVEEITKGYTNVSGVFEVIDPERTIETAKKINPELKEVYVLFDDTESGKSTGQQTINAICSAYPRLKVSTPKGVKIQDILDEVKGISGDSVILITTYYLEGEGFVSGFKEFCRLVSQNSRVPVYDLYDFGIGNGIIGGSMLSGRVQGEKAGKIAAQILNGVNISQIPMDRTKNTQFIFDYNELKRFNIPLNRLPDESSIVNNPFTFFETYKNIVITVVIIISMLIIFILILLFYLGKINKMKQDLTLKNMELSDIYEELVLTNKTLSRQYDKLNKAQLDLIKSENKYYLLFEKMLNGFFVFEPVLNRENKVIDIRFVDVNPGFETQTKLNIDRIVGKTWTEVFGYPSRELSIYQNILLTGEGKWFEAYYPDENVYYLVNAFKINENQVACVFDNITEYKLAIKEIKKLNEVLEQRVIERTRELQNAVTELEAFAYTVSHDLKSPLRAVDGYSKFIFEDYGDKLDEEVSNTILDIRSICSSMIEMITRLLQYSTTSRAGLNKEVINLEEVFRRIYSELCSANNGKDVKLIIDTGIPNVCVDKVLIRQAIYNILSNAFKFTRNREDAVIHVGSTITESEYIFYIRDNGVGFDMEFSQKLFGIFQRLHTSDEFEGSGIGLVTVKKIIQKHGGRVWIEGKLNEGATVYFTLPFE